MPPLPDIPPHKPKKQASRSNSSPPENNDGSTKIALRTEDEQQAAAREREERERAALEKEVNDRREARRKSLANRRVSFAAEATLHTFHEVEYMQDSTTSTDSTRRASSLAAPSPAPRTTDPASDGSEPPPTPPEQIEKLDPESPANQRDLHQRKRRRSSGVPSLHLDNPNDNTIGSTVYDSDSENGDAIEVDHIVDPSDSGSDSDEGDGTMVTVDADETTSASISTVRSPSSVGSASDLDAALRMASRRAGDQADETRRNQYVGEDEEVIPGFGWKKKTAPRPPSHDTDSQVEDDSEDTGMDMEITQAGGGIMESAPASPELSRDHDMSMDVTQAYGGIIG